MALPCWLQLHILLLVAHKLNYEADYQAPLSSFLKSILRHFRVLLTWLKGEKTYSAMTNSICLTRTPIWYMWKPGIKFCDNAPGISLPVNLLLPSRVRKENTSKTLEMHRHFRQTFETDVLWYFWDLFIIFSFLSKLMVQWDNIRQPKIGQWPAVWPATSPFWQHWFFNWL